MQWVLVGECTAIGPFADEPVRYQYRAMPLFSPGPTFYPNEPWRNPPKEPPPYPKEGTPAARAHWDRIRKNNSFEDTLKRLEEFHSQFEPPAHVLVPQLKKSLMESRAKEHRSPEKEWLNARRTKQDQA